MIEHELCQRCSCLAPVDLLTAQSRLHALFSKTIRINMWKTTECYYPLCDCTGTITGRWSGNGENVVNIFLHEVCATLSKIRTSLKIEPGFCYREKLSKFSGTNTICFGLQTAQFGSKLKSPDWQELEIIEGTKYFTTNLTLQIKFRLAKLPSSAKT